MMKKKAKVWILTFILVMVLSVTTLAATCGVKGCYKSTVYGGSYCKNHTCSKSGCKNLWLYDPDGNGIELQEYTPESVQMQSNEAPYEFGREGYVGIGHACFVCKDIEDSLDFYCNKLGMKLVGIQNDDEGKPWLHYVRMADGVYLELIPNGEGENPNKGWNSRGFQHLCLETDDLLADVERLRGIGVEIDQEPKTSSDKNWQAWIHDPDGNKVELMMIDSDSPQAKA